MSVRKQPFVPFVRRVYMSEIRLKWMSDHDLREKNESEIGSRSLKDIA